MKKGAALLERMVHAGSVCLRRLADGKRADEVQFNRFLANRKVTVERLIAGWGDRTAAAAAGRHVLAIQDTSEIHFRTTRARTRGLGEIGKGVGRGVLLHAMVGVDAASGACLGLVAGAIWTRRGRISVPHDKRPLAEKESRRWIETAGAAKEVLASAASVTIVADREADLYALWALVPRLDDAGLDDAGLDDAGLDDAGLDDAGLDDAGLDDAGPAIHVLGRVHYDRSLIGGGTLASIARQWQLADTRSIMLRERPDRPERAARVELRYGAVTIARPRQGDRDLPAQVELRLVELREPDPPPGAEPISWRLLTTHAVPDAAAAWRIVAWYRARWIIEQLFRLLKRQGLRLEDSQVETADRLLKVVAIAAEAAAITLQLVQARDGGTAQPASVALSDAELATLDALQPGYTGKTPLQKNPHPHRTLAWAAWLIARLGGWDGYPSSRPPGPITFKNGLDKLRLLAQGWGLRNVCMP